MIYYYAMQNVLPCGLTKTLKNYQKLLYLSIIKIKSKLGFLPFIFSGHHMSIFLKKKIENDFKCRVQH